MNYKPLLLLEDNVRTTIIQKCRRGPRWFTSEETSYTNAPINFHNIDNSTLYTEGKAFGIIDIPVI